MSAIAVREPQAAAVPLIVAVPHAGTALPAELATLAGVAPDLLRALADPWVDRLAADAPGAGAWVLETGWARAVADVNRGETELDPAVVRGTGRSAWTVSAKARAGLGVVPTRVAGRDLYADRLGIVDVERRLDLVYRPYHASLRGLIRSLEARFGQVLVLDLHSMPETAQTAAQTVDVALGDRYGRSAAGRWVALIERTLTASGLSVGRNRPYAGGYVTESYGRPRQGVHVVQLEFRRRLYMDEAAHRPHDGITALQAHCACLFRVLAGALGDSAPGPLAIAGE